RTFDAHRGTDPVRRARAEPARGGGARDPRGGASRRIVRSGGGMARAPRARGTHGALPARPPHADAPGRGGGLRWRAGDGGCQARGVPGAGARRVRRGEHGGGFPVPEKACETFHNGAFCAPRCAGADAPARTPVRARDHQIMRALRIVLGLCWLIALPCGALAAEGLPSHAPVVVDLGFFKITNSMVLTWIVAVALIVFAQYATRNIRAVPEGAQNFWEWI